MPLRFGQNSIVLTLIMVIVAAWFVSPARADTLGTVPADHAQRMTRGTKLFADSIRAILSDECLKCHGGDRIKSGFDLASRESLLKGGENGVFIIPGDSRSSKLMQLLRHKEEPFMPSKKPRLTEDQITAIAAWIDLGAPYDKPLAEKGGAKKAMQVMPEDRQFWSFVPLKRPAVPLVAGAKSPIDAFIASKLAEKRLTPGAPADRSVLIRRAYFDLIGLPPAPEAVDAFVADTSPDAYEKLIDRLLADPRHGERWAPHWLDVARFAESDGFEHDYFRPAAYHYRNFVIRALNDDLPYNQFVQWQIAGDEIEPKNPQAMMATGFLSAGVFPTQITEKEFESTRYDQLDDMINTIGPAFLGLTIGCARCHDHKYDPIPTLDYYRLAANFTRAIPAEVNLSTDNSGKAMAKVRITTEGLPPIKNHADERKYPHFYPVTHLLERGDPGKKGGPVTGSFLQVLMRDGADEKTWRHEPPAGSKSSHQRRALAEWITDTQRGAGDLAARVAVNRIWQHHMGRGIVATPNDFGFQGDHPTHPELLDWLATEFIDGGWRVKRMHKLIMMSATYKQSATQDAADAAIDPQNRYLWRYSPRRLEGESIRDSMLFVSGLLDGSMYGSGTLDEKSSRRSVYFTVKRANLVPSMVLFDWPERLGSIGARPQTTISPQALLFMNNPQVRRYAEALANRITPEFQKSSADGVRFAHRLAFGHAPSQAAVERSIAFIERQQKLYAQPDPKRDAKRLALVDFCQALMSLNEFVYID